MYLILKQGTLHQCLLKYWAVYQSFGTGFQVILNRGDIFQTELFPQKKTLMILNFFTLLSLIEHICLAKCGTSLGTKTKQCDRNFSFLKRETHCNRSTSETMPHPHMSLLQHIIKQGRLGKWIRSTWVNNSFSWSYIHTLTLSHNHLN